MFVVEVLPQPVDGGNVEAIWFDDEDSRGVQNPLDDANDADRQLRHSVNLDPQ